jgi:hypothetical protein
VLSTISPALHAQAAYYRSAIQLTNMLEGKDSLDLCKAVLAVEGAYYDGRLNEEAFLAQLDYYARFCRGILASGNIQYMGREDERVKTTCQEEIAAETQCAVFTFMADSIPVQVTADSIGYHLPFSYNYDDYTGNKDWSNMFVTTLMQTGKGNCHSMPLLYKLIMDRLGQESWLALAPNHLYIKAYSKQTNWYNIELTCGDCPTDAWLMASGYIHLDAVRNGIYMDTLSVRQSVALCLTDLAQGYMHKYGIRNGHFILQCLNTALKYYPHYINALLLKADIITALYQESPSPQGKEKIDALYSRIHQLGYRRMPEKMYLRWLHSLKEEYSQRHSIQRMIKDRVQ